MTNIAIVGQMYAGKTTLAEALFRVGGHNRVLMAGPLKAIARLAFDPAGGIDKGKMYKTTYGLKSGRQILQEVGQSMKEVDRDFWLNCFFNDIENTMMQEDEDVNFVVDDVRFLFEANALRERKWYVIKVETPEEVRLARGREALGRDITPEELGHESEVEVGLIIPNFIWDGTTPLEEYDDRVKSMLHHLGK